MSQQEGKYYKEMIDIAKDIEEKFNGTGGKKVGFVLMIFPYHDADGRCNYISNGADRGDMIMLMKGMISRFEGQAEVTLKVKQ